MPEICLADIEAAAARIAPYAHRTPVLSCGAIDAACAARIHFKCENFQKVGAFKFRGALNAVLSLTDTEAAAGVATHSSGNHAQALALAARLRGIPAFVVMPTTAPRAKREAVAGYGAEIISCAPTLAAREDTLAEVVQRTGAHFVHPYDDERVIAGQGTAARELLAEVSDLEVVMTPVGGGGLLAGTAIAVGEIAPQAAVIAAEPAGADDACRSLAAGEILPSVRPGTLWMSGTTAAAAIHPMAMYKAVEMTGNRPVKKSLKTVPASASPQTTANIAQPQLPRMATRVTGVYVPAIRK